MGENRLKLQQESWRLDIRKSFLVQEHMKMEHGVLCSLPGRSGPERSGSANSARQSGVLGRRASGRKVGEASSLRPVLKGAGG